MTAITSAQAGNWSDTATWVGGVVPANSDSVTQNHAITFDVDQSGFANGITLTLNAALTASSAAGSYLKYTNISYGASGSLSAGSSGTPLAVSFTIHQNANLAPNMGAGKVNLYGTIPAVQTALLSSQAGAGASTLELDTDVSASWSAGDVLIVCNVNRGRNAETHTIQSISGSSVTLVGTLSATKIVGSVVALRTRKVRYVGPGTTQLIGPGSSANVFSGVEFYNGSVAVNSASNVFTSCVFSSTSIQSSNTYNSCVMVNCDPAVNAASNSRFNNCVFAGNNGSVNGGTGIRLNTCTIKGNARGFNGQGDVGYENIMESCTISGNTQGSYAGRGHVFLSSVFDNNTYGVDFTSGAKLVGCTLQNNANGLYRCAGASLSDCSFSSNTIDLAECTNIIGYGITLGSATQVSTYSVILDKQLLAYNISGTAGSHRAWMAGGRVLAQGSTVPTGYTVAHQFVYEQAANTAGVSTPTWLDIPINAYASKKLTITTYIRSDTAFASMSEAFRVQIVDLGDDPLFGGTALAETVASGAINTWHTLTTEYTPVSDMQNLVVRFYGRNASGNNYAAWDIASQGEDIYYYSDSLTANLTEDTITADITD